MKRLITNIALMILSISIVGCASNTQSTNTGIGAASGAVLGGLAGSAIGAGTGQAIAIGAGAVAGALFGGYIGHSMDSSDKNTANQAMDHNKPYQSTSWNNKTTGAKYKVKPTSTMMSYKGHTNCRKFHTVEAANGQKQHVDGIACRQPNGMWQPVSATT